MTAHVAGLPHAHPATGATHTGMTLVLGSVPVACIPFAYLFSLPCWGRPSGCIIPKPLRPDPVACIFLHLPKSICCSCLTCQLLSPARSSSPRGLRTGTVPVHGSVPTTPTNLSSQALARGTPRVHHLTRPSVPSSSCGATSGRPAIVVAICVPPRANLQEPPEDNSRRYCGLPLLPCNSLTS